MPPKPPILFGKFAITSQVFHTTPFSMAFVNLKPLLPGHVLVSPRRVVSRLSELSQEEVSDLFLTVQRVGRLVERVYGASSLNIAIQDGVDAGQSVPHVHTHIIPRKHEDMRDRGGNDAIYGLLEGKEGDIGHHFRQRDGGEQLNEPYKERPKFPTVDDATREPRTAEAMESEAEMLTKEMESSKL